MNILLCSDGSTEAANALRSGATLAVAFHAHVTLLGVAETLAQYDRTQKSLQKSCEALAEVGVDCEVVIRVGEPTREIVRLSEEERSFDLVVIGARRKSGAGRYWRSARVYQLIRALRSPVLVVIGRREKLARMLVCSGGGAQIAPAVGVTADLAAGAGAAVTLLHILAQPAVKTDAPSADPGITEKVMGADTELSRRLRAEESRLQTAGVRVQVRVRQGPMLHELAEEIRDGEYDMVVTGTALASSPLRRYIMGDVTREIVNRVGCPVLVVPSRPVGEELPAPVRSRMPTPRRTWRFLFGQPN